MVVVVVAVVAVVVVAAAISGWSSSMLALSQRGQRAEECANGCCGSRATGPSTRHIAAP